MKRTLTALLLLALVAGCNKDKFQTKPQIRLLSTSSLTVAKPGPSETTGLEINLEFTDKEGDVDDSLFIRRVRTNSRPPGNQGLKADSFWVDIPDFPDRQKGEMRIFFTYENLKITVADLIVPGSNPPRIESDSITYKFVVKDRAGNKSDTLVLPGVVVER